MANEIRANAKLSFSKGGSSDSFDVTATIDMAGSQYAKKTQTVGTSEENLDKGDVGTIGRYLVKNLDPDNFVQLGPSTGVYSEKLLPGESAMGRWAAANIIAKADTAPCLVEYFLIEA